MYSAQVAPAHVLEDLKVMVVEDSLQSRGLIKSYLLKFGIQQIRTDASGTQVLTDDQFLDVDVLIIGFGLGYCHSGIELVKELEIRKLLPPWCKVIFITNAEAVTTSNLPSRHLKCEVLGKPINPTLLHQLLGESYASLQRFKGIIQSMAENRYQGLLIRLEAIPQGELSQVQRDELAAITMQVMIKMARGAQAWQLTSTISDELFRATNRLNVAYALGDRKKLALSLKMLEKSAFMRRRCLMYQISEKLDNRAVKDAHEALRNESSHTYSLIEVELCALLTLEVKGLDAAVDFLNFKRGTSLDNVFFRNAISLMTLKIYLYHMLTTPTLIEGMENVHQAISDLYAGISWHKGRVDFSPAASGVMAACAALCKFYHASLPGYEWQLEASDRVLPDEPGLFTLLNQAIILYTDNQTDKALEKLHIADEVISTTELCADALVARLWFNCVFEAIVSEPKRAREYNRIGLYHFKARNPYPALNMFYTSYTCEPGHAAIAINLLDTLLNLGLEHYWDIDVKQLAADIRGLKLRDNEKRKFAQVVSRLHEVQASG